MGVVHDSLVDEDGGAWLVVLSPQAGGSPINGANTTWREGCLLLFGSAKAERREAVYTVLLLWENPQLG